MQPLFKEYISEGLAAFSEGMSKEMSKSHFQFVNVQGGVDSDVVNLVDERERGYKLPTYLSKT